MKRILLTTILSGSALAVFGQGQLVFENANGSSTVGVCLNHLGTTYAAPTGNPGFGVALLWYNGSSFQILDNYQSVPTLAGTFNAGVVTIPTYQATGTFEVAGWYNPGGNYASYAAAAAAPGSLLGLTTSFTAHEALSPNPVPSIVPGDFVPPGAWNGNLVLGVPEPSTIALAGLGAATLLLFRRRISVPPYIAKTTNRQNPVKRILLAAILSGSALTVFGQGYVSFANSNNSSSIASVSLNRPGSAYYAPAGNPGFAVALLWYNGSSYQLIENYQSPPGNVYGAFNAGVVTIPTYSATGTFEIEGWYNPGGNYANYAAAAAASGSYLGITTSFTSAETMSPTFAPAMTPDGNSAIPAGAWDGGLVLFVPEPSTIALGGLAAATLLLFRRRKSVPNASQTPQTDKIL